MNRYRDWLEQSERDMKKARLDLEHKYYEWACFTAQQAAEKAVKALFMKMNKTVRGHSIYKFLEAATGDMKIDQDMLHYARVLDRYYIESRCPNGFPSGRPMDFFDSKIAEEAVDAAGRIIGFCKNTIDRL